MKRRTFLGGVGAALSGGVLGRRVAAREETIDVRVWFSEAAAEHDGLRERVAEYLGGALEAAVDDIRLSFGEEAVTLPAEGGQDVLGRRWPATVLGGLPGLNHVDPVDDVNLLVTDGDPTEHPAGYGRPHAAAVTGAEYIADMPPADEVGDDRIVPYTTGAVATQLLLHECGHALGLDHDDGTAWTADGAVVASPMIASYLWSSADLREKQLDSDGNACGASYPATDGGRRRRLSLEYAGCATHAIRQYRGGLVP